MKFICLLSFLLMIESQLTAQTKSENIVIVTLDGMRWQEVFGGADKVLLKDKRFTKEYISTYRSFWNDSINERRKKLFPFLWSVVAKQGQIYGNRNYDNNVNNANPYFFSYPGYNELFTGYPDKEVNSNNKILNNPNNIFINYNSGNNNPAILDRGIINKYLLDGNNLADNFFNYSGTS